MRPFATAIAATTLATAAHAGLPECPGPTQKVVAGATTYNEGFGFTLASSANVLLVGQRILDVAQPDSVTVFEFDDVTGNLTQTDVISSGAAVSTAFGAAMDIEGPLAIIGALADPTAGSQAGAVFLYDVSDPSNVFATAPTITPSDASRGSRFGSAVALSQNLALIGAYGDADAGNSAGAAYVFDVSDPAAPVELAKIVPTDAEPLDFFGHSVAIEGTRAAVGSIGGGQLEPLAGSVYLYDLCDPNNPVQTATIVPPDAGERDAFGYAIALRGDLLAIGAPFDDDAGFGAGSVYLYDVSDFDNPVLLDELLHPEPLPSNRFGSALDLERDRLIVGAPRESPGSVYVFDVSEPTNTRYLGKVVPPEINDLTNFGIAIDAEGVFFVAGSAEDDSNADPLAGSVFEFRTEPPIPDGDANADQTVDVNDITFVVQNLGNPCPDPVPTGEQLAKLQACAADPAADRGFAVAVGQGFTLVGAPESDINGNDAGLVYVFSHRPGLGRPVLVATISPDDAAPGDEFGASIAASGLVAIIGAPGDDPNGTDSGSAYIFRLANPAQPQLDSKLIPPDGQPNDNFGNAVDIDIFDDLAIVGASRDDDDGTDSGSAYLYQDPDGFSPFDPVVTAKIRAADANAGDLFGSSLSIDEGLLVIGAYRDDPNGTDSGSAYVFDVSNPNAPSQRAKLTASDGAANDIFGFRLDFDAPFALLGAPFDDDLGSASGSAYLFDLTNPDAPTQTAKLTASDGSSFDFFGRSVALLRTAAVVGADGADAPDFDSGAAYFFDVTNPAAPAQVRKATPRDASAGAKFGWSVDTVDTNSTFPAYPQAAIGAVNADDTAADSGAAYHFDAGTFPIPCDGDANNDGVVDVNDITLVVQNLGTTCP